MALQHLRTSTAHKRPIPSVMSAGQLAVNINEASPGLFFKDSNGDLVKVGPVHIGTDAPNSSPASVAATALVTGTVYQILTVGTSDFTGVGASANTVGTVFTATGTTTGTGTVSGQQGVEKGEQWLDTTGGTYVLKIYDGTAWRSESGTFVDVNGDTMTGALLLDNASSAAAPDLSFDGDANTGIYSPGADQVAISTGGAGRLFIDNVGNVGAGTSSPESKFHARADGNDLKALLFLQNRNGGANAGVQISLSGALNDLSENRLAYIRALNTGASQNGNHLTFGTNPNGGPPVERMRITSAGQMVIGGTSALDSDKQLTLTTTSTSGGLGILSPNNGRGDIFFGDAADDNIGQIKYSHVDDSLTIRTNAADRFMIDSSGNVGIGTTSPRGNLHLHSSSATRFDLTNTATGTTSGDGSTISIDGSTGALNIIQREAQPIIFNTSNTQVARIDSSGRVGIGTTSPSQLLDLASTAPNIRLTDTVDGHSEIDGNAANLKFNADKGNVKAGSNISFAVDNSERMRITSTGQMRLAGAGITFNGDTATANELDDYEEGTFTPVLMFGSNTTGITYNARAGFYVKVGKVVHTWVYFNLSNKGTATGSAQLSQFPFTTEDINVAGLVNWPGAQPSRRQNQLSSNLALTMVDNSINCAITDGAGSSVTDSSFTNGTILEFALCYRAA